MKKETAQKTDPREERGTREVRFRVREAKAEEERRRRRRTRAFLVTVCGVKGQHEGRRKVGCFVVERGDCGGHRERVKSEEEGGGA